MRIGFDAKRAFMNRSGLGNYSRSLISGLATYHPDDELIAFTPAMGDCYMDAPTTLKISYPSGSSPFWRSFGIKGDISKSKLNVFHGLSNELPFGIHKLPVSSVVSIHDLIFKRYPEQYPLFDRQIYDIKVRLACKQANHIIAISEQTKSDIIKYYAAPEKKISVVYQSCDPAFHDIVDKDIKAKIRSKFSLPSQFILSVSSLTTRKNLEALIKAIPMVDSGISLVIVGRGDQKMKLQRLVLTLGLDERVWILDTVDNDSLPAIYQMSSVFVYPSLFEGFGIPILEAMVSKVPVVVGQNSCFPEVAGPNAIYVDQNKPDSIAAGINLLLDDHHLHNQIAGASHNFAKRFNLENVIGKLHETYENL